MPQTLKRQKKIPHKSDVPKNTCIIYTYRLTLSSAILTKLKSAMLQGAIQNEPDYCSKNLLDIYLSARFSQNNI